MAVKGGLSTAAVMSLPLSLTTATILSDNPPPPNHQNLDRKFFKIFSGVAYFWERYHLPALVCANVSDLYYNIVKTAVTAM